MIFRKAKKADDAQGPEGPTEALQDDDGTVHAEKKPLLARMLAPRKERPAKVARSQGGKWELDAVSGNLTISKEGRIMAWYLARNTSYSYRTVRSAEMLITDAAAGLNELEPGTRVHLRVTSRPFPVSEWAERSWKDAPAPTDEYAAILERDQMRLANADQTDKLVFWGIEVGSRSSVAAALASAASAVRAKKTALSIQEAESRELAQTVDRLDEVMAAPGVDSYAATPREMDWLVRKSLGLGCSLTPTTAIEDDDLDAEELSDFTRQVSWSVGSLADSVEVVSSQEATQQSRHAVVLTLAALPELLIPEVDQPWIARADQLGFPLEWSIRLTIEDAEETQAKMNKLADRVRAQRSHYEVDHGIDAPRQLTRQAVRIAEIEDELRNANGLTTRVAAQVRVAVFGSTEREALGRAERLGKLYSQKARWVRHLGQYHQAREFVPMERPSDSGSKRRMSIVKFAAGLPNAATEFGDRTGINLGIVSGMSKQAAILNPWWGPEHNRSGLMPVAGTLGSGKTLLALLMLYKTGTQGVPWTVLDPSSLMGELAQHPGMRSFSRSINLLGAENGALNPYALVPDPNPADFGANAYETGTEYDRAVKASNAQRRSLVREVLTGCLPGEKHGNKHTIEVLRQAVNRAPAYATSTIDGVLHELSAIDGDQDSAIEAAKLVETFRFQREAELPRLFFADGSSTNDGTSALSNSRVTFFGLKGLVAPPEGEEDRTEWTEEQLLYRPLLNLASWAALREIYRRPRTERKGVIFDEAHEITASGVGQTLIQKSATDSRKHNLVAMMLTQNPSGITNSSIANFVGTAFIGRMVEQEEQRGGARLLGLPDDDAYAAMFGNLSRPKSSGLRDSGQRDTTPREFIAKDYHGNIEKITVDQNHHAEFMRRADSTPVEQRPTEEGTSGPFEEAA